jgi:hypothetical protein
MIKAWCFIADIMHFISIARKLSVLSGNKGKVGWMHPVKICEIENIQNIIKGSLNKTYIPKTKIFTHS